jgi:hypothetical protein
MSATGNERLRAELAEMRKTIESITRPNIERVILNDGELLEEQSYYNPQKDYIVIRLISPNKPRTEPIIFREGCPMDSEGMFPQGAQVGDKYIKNGVEYAIQEN